MPEFGRTLIILGLATIAVGLLFTLAEKSLGSGIYRVISTSSEVASVSIFPSPRALLSASSSALFSISLGDNILLVF